MPATLERLRGGLVVSCQAREGNPLHGPVFMAAMAAAAVAGGAVGIRADGVADISAIRQAIGPDVPIMGISKLKLPDGSLFITPTGESAAEIVAAGANLVALEATTRPRPGGQTLAAVVDAIHAAGALAMADCGTLDDARQAVEGGVDAVGTTMSGYVGGPKQAEPDFELIERMAAELPVPVFAEGRLWTREDARKALDLGAAFVVVGTAITNPQAITERFVAALH
ncbi:MAG: N-acetylmannosamine-6-phosphate 2-epimerase [Thermomicrobiales bacterium]|nr:N-acetylmannosamine-6-phosphate 2-epimerase [Thermomicrobiales bacterium]